MLYNILLVCLPLLISGGLMIIAYHQGFKAGRGEAIIEEKGDLDIIELGEGEVPVEELMEEDLLDETEQ